MGDTLSKERFKVIEPVVRECLQQLSDTVISNAELREAMVGLYFKFLLAHTAVNSPDKLQGLHESMLEGFTEAFEVATGMYVISHKVVQNLEAILGDASLN